MVLVGQAGSGLKGQTRNYCLHGRKRVKRKRMERWACRRLVQGRAGKSGTVVRISDQSGSSEPGEEFVT